MPSMLIKSPWPLVPLPFPLESFPCPLLPCPLPPCANTQGATSTARARACSDIFCLVAKTGNPPYGVYVLSVAIALMLDDNCVENLQWGDFVIISLSAQGAKACWPPRSITCGAGGAGACACQLFARCFS